MLFTDLSCVRLVRALKKRGFEIIIKSAGLSEEQLKSLL